MKIELTQLQADKIIQALKEKFHATHDAGWLGLQTNLEMQMRTTYYKGYKIEMLAGVYWAQGSPFAKLKDAKHYIDNYYNTAEYRHKISQP